MLSTARDSLMFFLSLFAHTLHARRSLLFDSRRTLPKLFASMSDMAALHPDAGCADMEDDDDDDGFVDAETLRLQASEEKERERRTIAERKEEGEYLFSLFLGMCSGMERGRRGEEH